MWDSLESVWEEASADPRCNVTVVPVPYYDKTADGKLGKAYYEGELFPDNVTTVHYDNYDVTVIRPDIAYFHNSYDQHNNVTSIDPRFYSHELKKSVGKLVYVPYYVSRHGNALPYNSSLLSGGADIVVAFNNTDYHTYQLLRHNKDIAVLGSPKIDRVLRLDREKPDMPEDWKPILEGKKVFLLITSVSTILSYDKVGEKLRKIISLFENRDDIAMIWRPHPLSDSTIKSMRPQLLEEYKALEKRVASSSFGVLDYTPDAEFSMALSDAYIGAGASSLFYMYCVTGKPTCAVSFENIVYTDDDYDEALRVETLVYMLPDGGEDLWGVCTSFNGLCKMNVNDGQITYVSEIPGEFSTQKWLFTHVIKLENKLLLVPCSANAFVIYDIGTGEFKSRIIPENAGAEYHFSHGIEYKKYIYFVPARSKAIARFHIETEELEYFYGWHDKISPFITQHDQHLFAGSCVVKDSLYLTSIQNSIITELNLETLEMSVHAAGNSWNRYLGIAHDGRYFWLTRFIQQGLADNSDSIVRWDSKSGKTTEFKNFPDGFGPKENIINNTHLSGIKNFGKYLLALPYGENSMIVRIDPQSCTMTEFKLNVGVNITEREKPFFEKSNAFAYFHILNENELYVIIRYDNSLLKINTLTGKTEKVKLRFKDASHKNQMMELPRFSSNGVFYEHMFFPVERFIDSVMNGEIPPRNETQAAYYKSLVENTDGTCGKKIHEYVMRSVTGHA
jgi:hypothetical protein